MLARFLRNNGAKKAPIFARGFALAAHGPTGKLINPLVPKDTQEWADLRVHSSTLPEVVLSYRNLCDIELILNGGFSPLAGFMTKDEYSGVCDKMRLPCGTLYPVPVNLDITKEKAKEIEESGKSQVVLKDMEGNPLAVMDIQDTWEADKKMEADTCWGGDPEHPAIMTLMNHTNDIYIGGKLTGLSLPPHYEYADLRKTPQETRDMFEKMGWNKVCAFQTRNPMHRAHYELTVQALAGDDEMKLLVHPVVGMTKPGDIDHHTRVKCYKEIMPMYPEGRAALVVYPLAMRMGGPREAIWHSIIRKNFGATHFIVGRDHAGPGSNSAGVDFYGPYDARDAAVAHEQELGIKLLSFEMMVYSKEHDKYFPINKIPEGVKPMKLSGTEVRRRLRTGEDIPEWFSYGQVVKILRKANPPRDKQGFCVFFTGLSGSGKTTVGNALVEKLMEIQDRPITVLDGDHVRQLLSSGLGFSKEDRVLNIKRIGYVASLVVKSGGIVIAAPIAPHEEPRNWAKMAIKEFGGFFLTHLATPIETCEDRDRKGLYKRARSGQLKGFTGIDDPYELPENPEIRIDTATSTIENSVHTIVANLVAEGYILPEGNNTKSA